MAPLREPTHERRARRCAPSAIAIGVNQGFWAILPREVELQWLPLGDPLQHLQAPLSGIAAGCCLEICEGLLVQAALVGLGTVLQQAMQRLLWFSLIRPSLSLFLTPVHPRWINHAPPLSHRLSTVT